MALLAMLALAVPSAPVANAQAETNAGLPTIRITAGMHRIVAEVADDAEKRRIGLMNRDSLAPNAGMLFVFDRAGVHCFWMRNTRIALSIAFIADDGTIVGLADMAPLDETSSHCPPRPVRFALEMTQGWFARRGLEAGMRLRADGVFPAGTGSANAPPNR